MIKPLTSLRFFAALLVFGMHCPLTMIPANRLQTGNAGVEFFFVLSGFILTYAHREFFGKSLAFGKVKEFWAARFARIYPVHVLAFAFAMYMVLRSLGTSWIWADPRTNLLALISQITLTQSWMPIDSYVNFNGVAWSISDEMFFYALFPLIALGLFSLYRASRWSVVLVAAALWGALAIVALHATEWFVYIFPPVRLLDFAAGACFGAIFTGGLRTRRPLPFALATALELGVIAAGIGAIWVTPRVPPMFSFSTLLLPFSVAIVYVFARSDGAVSKLLSATALVYLGEISYNFYMLHSLILVCIFSYSKAVAPAAVSVLGLVVCIAISVIVYERYEMPLRRRIRAAFAATVKQS